jgi:hypothetical protein
MPSPQFLTYDGDVANGVLPYRPGIDDVGGGQKLDDSEFPPDPQTMPTAADFNEMGMLLVALGKVTGAALILVANSGAPVITGLRAAGSAIVAGDFTVTRHAAGDIEIQCPGTKIVQPFAGLAFTQKAGDYRATGRVNATSDGIRIETRDSTGTLVDADFLALWV